MKELKFEELTTRQKLGMTFLAFLNGQERTKENDEFILDMIRNHSLGGVWISPKMGNAQELMEMVKAVADYPILIFSDAENGIGEYLIGRHNAIAVTGNTDHAYVFGKAVGVTARKLGYNIICNPVMDMENGSQRSLGTNKEKVSELAAAIARGMHDGGVLALGKHYPGAKSISEVDTHMAEATSADTKEDLLNYSLYPYKKLIEEGLLDGIMTQHQKLINIDEEHPASLSKKVIDIIREEGFDGISITDALVMMGIRAKYGLVKSKGLALSAGNDLIMPFASNNIELFDQYCQAYDEGLISEERLDEAVKRVLAAQHKTTLLTKSAELTEDEIEQFNSINKDGVYAKTDEGVPTSISRDGKHFFVIMTRCDAAIDGADNGGMVDVDTFSNAWHSPFDIKERLLKSFPNSQVAFINEFPTQMQNEKVLKDSIDCDELVFLTFTEALAYVGKENLTRRFIRLIEALQLTDRVSTIVHFGNPLVLEELPHIPRWIIGGISAGSINACIDVLEGKYPAKGVPTYNFNLK